MTTVNGSVAPGFAALRGAFEECFGRRGEVGAAVAVYHRGELVADLWGGWRDAERELPWEEDTLAWVASSTKGMTAVCANLLAQRGELDVDAPVADYWPEFKAAGKESIPVRWLLCHRAGLPVIDRRFSREEIAAWDPVCEALARQEPEWEPGTAHGYHGMTYGFLVGEVIRRISGRRPSRHFAEEVAAPLGLDTYIALPAQDVGRLARTVAWEGGLAALDPSGAADLVANSAAEVQQALRAMSDPQALFPRIARFADPVIDYTDPSWLQVEMPAATGVTTARSLARLYAALVGQVDGVRLLTAETVDRAREVQTDDRPDLVLGRPARWGLGFSVGGEDMLGAGSFGHAGAGGSVGFADPEAELGFAYVMNRLAEPFVVDRANGRIETADGGTATDLVDALRRCI